MRTLTGILTALAAMIMASGCSKSSGPGVKDVTTTGFDPWNAPTGAAIPGPLVSGGFGNLAELPASMNVEGGWTDSLAAAQSGHTLYFAYTRYDFYQFQYNNQAMVVTGPALTGMTGNAFKIFQADLDEDGNWNVSYHPVNSSDGTLNEFSPGVNATEDLMLFARLDPTLGDTDLYMASKTNATWSAPVAVSAINTPCNDDNPKPIGTPSAFTLFFESNRANPAGTSCGTYKRIFTATYANGAWGAVTEAPGINSEANDDQQPWPTYDLAHFFWTTGGANYGVSEADLESDGTYGNHRLLVQPQYTLPNIAGQMILVGQGSTVTTPEGTLLYMVCAIAYNEHGGNTYYNADNVRIRTCVARD